MYFITMPCWQSDNPQLECCWHWLRITHFTSVGLPPTMRVSIARAMETFFIISNLDWEYQQHVTFITLLWCVSHPVVGFPWPVKCIVTGYPKGGSCHSMNHKQKPEVDGFTIFAIHCSLGFTSWQWWFTLTQLIFSGSSEETRFAIPNWISIEFNYSSMILLKL